MTALRQAAQQALEALEDMLGWQSLASQTIQESAKGRAAALKAALAEPVQDTGVKLKPVFYAPRRLDDEEIEAIVGKPVQEPPCATRECMPSECPNCASLEAQNTELDRKLADLEQTSLELCNVCGWKTFIPGDCCLNCVRKPMNEFDALRLITESIGHLQSAGPVEGLIGIIRAVETAHGIK